MAATQGYRRIEGTERQPARDARLLGLADPTKPCRLLFSSGVGSTRPSTRSEPLAATPPARRTYHSRGDFARSYGADQTDLDKVVQFARSKGLTVAETNAARRTVIVSGTIKQMSDAFGVELGRYETPTETYRAG